MTAVRHEYNKPPLAWEERPLCPALDDEDHCDYRFMQASQSPDGRNKVWLFHCRWCLRIVSREI